MKMDPDTFTQLLQQTMGDQLRSVILYGSSVAGDFIKKRSDYNLLVVVDDLGLPTLKKLRVPISRWVKSGQRPPLLFTDTRLQQSADVFPIELYDLRDQHKVLHGDDVISRLKLTTANLRLQIESELKGKLISLREGYFACNGKPKPLLELMVASVSNFQVLMRATLRLNKLEIPTEKSAVVDLIANETKIDVHPFHQAAQLKAGLFSTNSIDAETLFASYLSSVEQLVDAVDAHKI